MELKIPIKFGLVMLLAPSFFQLAFLVAIGDLPFLKLINLLLVSLPR